MSTIFSINTTEAPEINEALADGDLIPVVNVSGTAAVNRTLVSRIATYILGAARTFTAALLSSSATGGIGYATGAGGTVTQATSITTGVTLSKVTGQITTVASTLAAGAEATFTVTNTTVVATDTIVLSTTYAGGGTPLVYCQKVAAGSFDISITNLHATAALDAALTINFAVVRGIAA